MHRITVSKAAWLCKLTAAALLWSQLAGCALVGWGDGRMAVVAFYSRYVEALQPEQVVKVMDRAGCHLPRAQSQRSRGQFERGQLHLQPLDQ